MTALKPDERAVIPSGAGSDPVTRVLGHPAAYAASAVLLLVLFAWPFITNADRVAPTKDPAYYTWRTEALLTETPETVLGIEGPNGMFAAGYRVAAPVIGGLLRHVGGVGSLSVTILLMVVLPVAISLLLAGFARRVFPDPLVWHAVAYTSAGLLLTPPFVGYLDNVLCLFFLAASLFFLRATAEGWPGREAFFALLLLAGLTHPTTLVIFCVVLGCASAVRLMANRFDVRDALRADGWMLGVAAAAAVTTVLIWTLGIWGRSVSLVEAALPPPYGSDFFVDRMMLWIGATRPALNGPLFLLGTIVLLATGKIAWRDHEHRIALVWLAPLAGCLGFLAGLTYPYYRFFNTTLSWVLLAGLGAGIAMRFFVSRAVAGRRVLALGALAIVAVLATNLTSGFRISGWTKVKNQWLAPEAKADLDVLRGALESESRDAPVIFVVDDEPPDPFQIYGFTKLSGNTSRYGLPAGQIDRGYLYLGDLRNLLRGEPTERGDETYDPLSQAFLDDTKEGMHKSDDTPIVVVASAFNPAGANVHLFTPQPDLPADELDAVGDELRVWTLRDRVLTELRPDGVVGLETSVVAPQPPAAVPHALRVLLGLAVLLLPGLVALRKVLPDATIADAMGLVPALALAIACVVGVIVLALVREPLSSPLAWFTVLGAVVVAVIGRLGPRRSPA